VSSLWRGVSVEGRFLRLVFAAFGRAERRGVVVMVPERSWAMVIW